MSLANPIRKPSQMHHPLAWNVPENYHPEDDMWWAMDDAAFVKKGTNPIYGEDNSRKMLELRKKLLSFGGAYTCLPVHEEDYDKIMNRGEFLYGTGAKFRKGKPSQCHTNASLLWNANRGRCQIATGYALSEDGIWRQHSWVVQPLTTKWRVWETTVKRIAYFGFVMNDEECEKFYDENT